jgi:hypothetical protein
MAANMYRVQEQHFEVKPFFKEGHISVIYDLHSSDRWLVIMLGKHIVGDILNQKGIQYTKYTVYIYTLYNTIYKEYTPDTFLQ